MRHRFLHNFSQRSSFLGFFGVYNTYIQSKPVSSAFLNDIKGSNSLYPEGEQPRLIGVEVRMTRATRIKTNRPPLATI